MSNLKEIKEHAALLECVPRDLSTYDVFGASNKMIPGCGFVHGEWEFQIADRSPSGKRKCIMLAFVDLGSMPWPSESRGWCDARELAIEKFIRIFSNNPSAIRWVLPEYLRERAVDALKDALGGV